MSYNNYPIKNVALTTNAYSQLDSSGVVVFDASGNTKTTMNANSIMIEYGTSTFYYSPLNLLQSVSGTLPNETLLPYQQYIGYNSTTSPITYLVPASFTMYYNGVNRSSVTLSSRGQSVTLGIIGGTQNYIVLATGGTVGSAGTNIIFGT